MDYKLSSELSKILILSKEEANKLQQQFVGSEHLLLGLIRNEKSIQDLFLSMNINPQVLEQEIISHISKESHQNQQTYTTLSLNQEATRLLRIGCLEARLYKEDVVKTEHLLLAMLRDNKNIAGKLLKSHQVIYEKVAHALNFNASITSSFNFDEDYAQSEESFPKEKEPLSKSIQENKQKGTPILDSLGTDLTQAALNKKFDPTIGREKEISRIAQILCRRKKNNPILIGEPGVGKSAIIEGLATAISNHNICWPLQNKRIIALDMGNLIAGTKYRGQFEERIQGILHEAKSNQNIILFIDEIHTIIGTGSTPGTIDAANMLKPALSRGEIQCIGATTIDEYRKTIEKDGALERRFQKVMIEPTTKEETLTILQNLKAQYEEFHHVTFSPEALKACVELSERYISSRFFPDKAIDVMDEAGSRAFLQIKTPDEIIEQENTIRDLTEKKDNAAKSQHYELAANIRDQIVNEKKTLERLKENWFNNQKLHREQISEENIKEIISSMSGIPISSINQSENHQLKGMQKALTSKIIGQDEAVSKVVKAITRGRIGIKDPNRPIGTFLFVGSTGVGKTHLVKVLSKYIFGSTDSIIRIDMSEYMDKYNVSRLVGAPPGYVGYEEGGQLTEKVRRHPYSIVLLDEIEKAHSDVYNLLLQVFDEGRLTDSYGTTIDFKNTIIIMTSNCGTRQLSEEHQGIGFATESTTDRTNNIIKKSLSKRFAPEFLNRLDEIIIFNPLDKDTIQIIAQKEINNLIQRLNQLHFSLQIDDNVLPFIVDKGFDDKNGARPLKRTIQKFIEDKISEFIINNSIKKGASFRITIKNDDTAIESITS